MLDWIKREPVIAARLLDVAMVAAGVALHYFGVELPDEFKLALDALLLAAIGTTTVAARGRVSPVKKVKLKGVRLG